MPKEYDKYVAKMVIEHTYKSTDGGSYGIAIKTDMFKNNTVEEMRPIIDQLNHNIAKRLGLPHQNDFNYGFYDGQTPENGEIRMAPHSDKVTAQQLKQAVEAEIKEAKARVESKNVGISVSIKGGTEADATELQAGGKGVKSNQR